MNLQSRIEAILAPNAKLRAMVVPPPAVVSQHVG